jgi:regulator of cell morphogenesis and NO signaling
MTITDATSLRDIVTADFRAAAVLERHGVDFCCGGTRSLGDAAREAGVGSDALRSEIERALAEPAEGPRFNDWAIDFLAEFIVGNHHAYVRQALPRIQNQLQKIVDAHGANHPELRQIARRFANLAIDLAEHLEKEEAVLFPYVRRLAAAARVGGRAAAPLDHASTPIAVMRLEHEAAGEAMHAIRDLSGGFAAPPDACPTYRACYEELTRFERDLHQHVHLENNILFPRSWRSRRTSQSPRQPVAEAAAGVGPPCLPVAGLM